MRLDVISYFAKTTMVMVLELSLPSIIVATSVGVLLALVQTLIQLQEQTLSFTVKLVSIAAVLFLTGAWMSSQMLNFLNQIFDLITSSN